MQEQNIRLVEEGPVLPPKDKPPFDNYVVLTHKIKKDMYERVNVKPVFEIGSLAWVIYYGIRD